MWPNELPKAFELYPLTPAPQTDAFLAGKLTALDAPGGGEIQMFGTAEGLRELGVSARLWRPWEESIKEAKCLHLFGSLPEHLPLIEAARRANLPVLLSTITWFDWRSYWREPGSVVRRVKAVAGFAARAAWPNLASWRRRLYHSVDLLLPNSNAEAAQLTRYFQVSPKKIHIVPNGADPRFGDAQPDAFLKLLDRQMNEGTPSIVRSRIAERRFVLYVGRIEPRKNQLGLIRAMRGKSVPVVLIGDAVPGHDRYWRACCQAADPSVIFLPRLDHDDPLLRSAYAACGCLALTGWYETPGLVALEAAMSGTPLVLPRGGSAHEYFGGEASYVAPDDLRGIRRAVLDALERPRSERIARRVQDNFTWKSAAEATLEAYRRVW
jgi:glycosyltransferase involved in cell wall biosynthesis